MVLGYVGSSSDFRSRGEEGPSCEVDTLYNSVVYE